MRQRYGWSARGGEGGWVPPGRGATVCWVANAEEPSDEAEQNSKEPEEEGAQRDGEGERRDEEMAPVEAEGEREGEEMDAESEAESMGSGMSVGSPTGTGTASFSDPGNTFYDDEPIGRLGRGRSPLYVVFCAALAALVSLLVLLHRRDREFGFGTARFVRCARRSRTARRSARRAAAGTAHGPGVRGAAAVVSAPLARDGLRAGPADAAECGVGAVEDCVQGAGVGCV
ncbi:hypothetical protein DFH07DRAFT_861802, partial [Mycena maculata]